MSPADLVATAPLIVPVLAATTIMLVGAFSRDRGLPHLLAVGGAGASVVAALLARQVLPRRVTPLLQIDAYAIFYMVILYIAVGMVAILVRPYLGIRRRRVDAFYALLLFAAGGMGVLACASHFASLFLGLEILTLSLYALIGYFKDEGTSLEAAAKYLVLAALSSGFLLMGIALVYAATGTLALGEAFESAVSLTALAGTGDPAASWALSGAVLLLVGFGFKLALVPFHMWSPDVYQGAPAPVTALIATGSKGAVLAVMLRSLAPAGLHAGAAEALAPFLAAVAVLTMFAGNLLALLQDNVKRLLGYSSIAHLGYVMVAMTAGGVPGSEAVSFYVLAYVFTTLGAFGVVIALSSLAAEEAEDLVDFRGLGGRRPFLGGVMTVMLLSLAGIPPTGGFLAKFAVLGAAVEADATGLAILMALASGIGVYYYVRVVVAMYMREPAGSTATPDAPGGGSASRPTPATPDRPAAPAPDRLPVPMGSVLTLLVVVLFIVILGVYPSPWLELVGDAVATLY